MTNLLNVRFVGAIVLVLMCTGLMTACYTQYAPATSEPPAEPPTRSSEAARVDRGGGQSTAETRDDRDGRTTYADEYRRSNRRSTREADSRPTRKPQQSEGARGTQSSRESAEGSRPVEVNYYIYEGPTLYSGLSGGGLRYRSFPVIAKRHVWNRRSFGTYRYSHRSYRFGYPRGRGYRHRSYHGGVGVSLRMYFSGGLFSLEVGYERSFARRSLVCQSYEYYYQSYRYQGRHWDGASGFGGGVGRWGRGVTSFKSSRPAVSWEPRGRSLGRTASGSSGTSRSRVEIGRRGARDEVSAEKRSERQRSGRLQARATDSREANAGRIGRSRSGDRSRVDRETMRTRSDQRVIERDREALARSERADRGSGRIGRRSSRSRRGDNRRQSREGTSRVDADRGTRQARRAGANGGEGRIGRRRSTDHQSTLDDTRTRRIRARTTRRRTAARTRDDRLAQQIERRGQQVSRERAERSRGRARRKRGDSFSRSADDGANRGDVRRRDAGERSAPQEDSPRSTRRRMQRRDDRYQRRSTWPVQRDKAQRGMNERRRQLRERQRADGIRSRKRDGQRAGTRENGISRRKNSDRFQLDRRSVSRQRTANSKRQRRDVGGDKETRTQRSTSQRQRSERSRSRSSDDEKE